MKNKPGTFFKWGEEHKAKLLRLYEKGYNYPEIAKMLKTETFLIERQLSLLGKWDILRTKITDPTYYPPNELQLLIDVGRFPDQDIYEMHSTNLKIYPVSYVLDQYETWENAVAKSKDIITLVNLDKKINKTTCVLYLAYFPDENFYKVGVSNQDRMETRFSGEGYPAKYNINNVIKLPAISAFLLERRILDNIRSGKLKYYLYEPRKFKGGSSECFRPCNPNNPPKTLKNLLLL